MVFLPGVHTLDTNITVTNVAGLTMCGESSSGNIATVVCGGSVGLSFTNIVDFNIYSLAFTSYRSLSYGKHPASNSALLLQSTQNAKLVNCSFHDNIGTSLSVRNTNVTLEGISKFIHNQCTCQSFSDSEADACGIAAINSNLTFIGNTSFLENNQTAPMGLFPLCQFPLCQLPLCQFPFGQLPTLSIPILSIPIWSMLTKRELTKWELTKWEVDEVGRFTV